MRLISGGMMMVVVRACWSYMTQQLYPPPPPVPSLVGGVKRVSRDAGEPRVSFGCWGTSVGAAVVVIVEGDIFG